MTYRRYAESIGMCDPDLVLVDDAATGAIVATVPEDGGGSSTATIFGTPGGYLAIDGDNGSLFGVEDAAEKSFVSAYAGTYTALAYSKHDVNLGPNPGEETGDPAEIVKATVTITAGAGDNGHILVEPQGGSSFESELVPLEDVSEFYGAGKIGGHPNGLFVFTDGNGSAVFVVFMDSSLAFGSYRITSQATKTYEYLYGFALKQP